MPDDQRGIYLVPRSWKTTPTPDEEPNSTSPPSAVSTVVHPSPPAAPSTQTPSLSTSLPPPSLHGHTLKDQNDPGYIDMTSPTSGVYRSPPAFSTTTIPEEETLSTEQTNDAYISLSDCDTEPKSVKETDSATQNTSDVDISVADCEIKPSRLAEETDIAPSQSEELHTSQSSIANGHSNYDVPPGLKSQRRPSKELHVLLNQQTSSTKSSPKFERSPSKELHVLPNQKPDTSSSSPPPKRLEKQLSLTKTLNQDVPLPKKTRQVRFNSTVESHHVESEESAEEPTLPDEVEQSTIARELKEQLPKEVSLLVKCSQI